MCGIVFSYAPGRAASELESCIRDATRCLEHRGPDAHGVRVQPPWGIGHRRLSIIDLSEGSAQPMTDPSGRYWLTYNGELYNYRELRRTLEPDWSFRTAGDTEVMLAGLIREGMAFLDRANGMWAAALWDSRARELLLVRDRMGKKPLYYQVEGKAFHCASELPALRTLAAEPWSEDPDSTADYLRYGYFLPGTTAYRNVFEILPGHVGIWSPDQSVSQRRYWQAPHSTWAGTANEAREALAHTVVDATTARLESDVEVGAFLSGGIDSSILVSILSNTLHRRPKTFTVGFEDATFDERSYARIVASKNFTDHYEKVLKQWDQKKLIRLVLQHFGQPFADNSLLATAEVAELAHDHVKVSLSGDGADELFSGYQRYQAQVLLQWYTRLPTALRRTAKSLARQMSEPTAHHSRSILKKGFLFLELADRMPDATKYVAPSLQTEKELEELAPDLAFRGHAPPMLPEETRIDDLKRMATMDSLVYLPQDILTKVDRASMANSLEVRCPFLDHRIVELAFQIPSSWHRRGVTGKRMLRDSLRDHLPTTIGNRRKQGFSVPVHEWFLSGLECKLLELLNQSNSPLAPCYVEKRVKEHRLGHRDHGLWLWSLYTYLLWHTHHHGASTI